MAHDGTTTILDIELGITNVALPYDKFANDSQPNFGSCANSASREPSQKENAG
jgi:hypothetical protein